MKKQPLLTGFPRTVFATARRKLQATIRLQREQMIQLLPSGYSVMFQEVLPASFLASIDPTIRQRHFGHIPLFWAWISQILEGNSSCSKAVSFVQAWALASGVPAPAADTSAYCKARERFSNTFIDAINQRISDTLNSRITDADRWQGFTLMAMDGSSMKLMDTAANQQTYPQPSVQQAGCGFPVMAISGLLNLSHGGWEAFETGSIHDHDLTLGTRLLDKIGENDLLLADRAYCSYTFLSKLRERGAHAIMRLNAMRDRALDWNAGIPISPYERLVTWKRPMFSNSSKSLTREQWQAQPEELQVRLIRLDYEDRCGQRRTMTVVTTLTDTTRYDGIELHALYAKRWEIELRLRDIKTTLGLEHLAARTPQMAEKSLAMIRIAYNLLRLLMQRAAHHAAKTVTMISFKGILDLVTTTHQDFRQEIGRPKRHRQRLKIFIEIASGRTLDIRPNRREPRAVKRRPKPFALLTSPRGEFTEISHRSRYRKSA